MGKLWTSCVLAWSKKFESCHTKNLFKSTEKKFPKFFLKKHSKWQFYGYLKFWQFLAIRITILQKYLHILDQNDYKHTYKVIFFPRTWSKIFFSTARSCLCPFVQVSNIMCNILMFLRRVFMLTSLDVS